jgi:hypothetical protein
MFTVFDHLFQYSYSLLLMFAVVEILHCLASSLLFDLCVFVDRTFRYLSFIEGCNEWVTLYNINWWDDK